MTDFSNCGVHTIVSAVGLVREWWWSMSLEWKWLGRREFWLSGLNECAKQYHVRHPPSWSFVTRSGRIALTTYAPPLTTTWGSLSASFLSFYSTVVSGRNTPSMAAANRQGKMVSKSAQQSQSFALRRQLRAERTDLSPCLAKSCKRTQKLIIRCLQLTRSRSTTA
jgi:hypothetical protein